MNKEKYERLKNIRLQCNNGYDYNYNFKFS